MTDTEGVEEGVANDSMASAPRISGSGNCPGPDADSRDYVRASLKECLDRNLSRVPSLAAPAAYASEGAAEYLRSQSNPRQVMS